MAGSNQYLDYIHEQLRGVEGLISRRMFGGAGLYSREVFFGLIYKDRLYFKTDDASRSEYEARGGEAFRPRPKLIALKSAYYSVPADVLEDAEELVQWARKAVAAALASQAEKAARKKPSTTRLKAKRRATKR